jgi:hypothetical protein
MNIDLKNTIIIGIVLYIVYRQYLKVYNKETFEEETFTQKEMKNYPNMLKNNCRINKKLHKQLINANNTRCNAKGKTYRETINNKRLCYDDIHKEIVTGFDAESNCVVSNMINKDKPISNFQFSDMRTAKSISSQSKMKKLSKNSSKASISKASRSKSSSSKLVRPQLKMKKLSKNNSKSGRPQRKMKKLSKNNSKSSSSKSSKLSSSKSAKSSSSKTSSRSSSSASNLSVKRSKLAEARFPSRNNIVKKESQNMKLEEGPDFINKFYRSTYQSHKGNNNFAAFNATPLGAPTGDSHKYANISSYSDVSFSSDPAFLSRLSNYENAKPL